MVSAEIQTRVRYGETDKMGYVYYGNYALYFEIGRTELMRKLGFPYRRLEDVQIEMPVLNLSVNYYKPAHYDDLISIKTTVREKPGVRIKFFYEIFSESGILLTTGETTLAFVDSITHKPRRPQPDVLKKILQFF